MTRSFEIIPLARKEIEQAVAYYKQVASSDVAMNFLSRLQEAMQRVEEFPHSGAKFHTKYRRMLLRSFPYAVIYSVQNSAIMVIAVMNVYQKPDSFEDRFVE
jgi:plasmid stabilization system protein ParE